MNRINSLNELKDGDIVHIFGPPFCSSIAMYNPFVARWNSRYLGYEFFSTVDDDISQMCSVLREDTFIVKGENLSVEDEAVLILEGFIE